MSATEVAEQTGSGPASGHKSYGSFASFSDPDGNGWLLQEVTARQPQAGGELPS